MESTELIFQSRDGIHKADLSTTWWNPQSWSSNHVTESTELIFQPRDGIHKADDTFIARNDDPQYSVKHIYL